MTTSPELDGVLAVDKPVGPTSHDAVATARRALHTRRIGHTGTLDPFASGLLLLCVGRATRIAEYLTAQPKRYSALMRLGQATDTEDCTGQVIAVSEAWRSLTRADVEAALLRQQGERLQRPPAYSAKKLAGRKLYELAREGTAPELPPVPVVIHEIRMTSWSAPDAGFEVTCSSGTYVRSIARDVGAELNVGAHLVELRRLAIGNLPVSAAVPLEELREHGLRTPLLEPLAALAHLPRVDVDDTQAAALRHGRSIPAPDAAPAGPILLAWHGRLAAIASAVGGRLQPRKVLLDG